jgi:hypothetical protein
MRAMTTLEQEVMDLKTRLGHLEAVIRRLTADFPQAGVPVPPTPLDQPELLAWLKANGLIREPTAEECRVAAAWDALSDEDKQRHIDDMQHLVLDPPLSQILIAQRR